MHHVAGFYYTAGESDLCIDCCVRSGRYASGERFSLAMNGMFCVCLCCGPSGQERKCHRSGQTDRLNDLLYPVKGAIGPDLVLPEI